MNTWEINRIANKDPIVITDGRPVPPTKGDLVERHVEMGENNQGYLLLLESGPGEPKPYDWMAFTPEEMARILASCSGQWVERFNAEIERINKDYGDAAR